MDPYVISSAERTRFEQQFNALNPINGIVTGDQAKGFLLQSQLPPAILGVIWALADTDADGKMNINEFSIACKLINLKLRGFELPKALPPSLQALVVQPSMVQSKPSIPPLPGGTGPLIPGLVPLATSAAPVSVVASKNISPPSGRPSPITSPLGLSSVPPPKPPQPILPPQPTLLLGTSSPAAQLPVAAPLLPGLPMMPSQPGMTPMPPPSPVPPSTLAGLNSLAQNAGSSPPTQPTPPTPPIAVAAPAASQHPPMERERLPSLESPLVEWAIPMASKLKYTQLFNTTDKKRSGFLTGPQARQILLASKLPQPILAQIWTLSDMDADGRLSCEEFVLALHLCDMARNGDTLPTSLPPQLVPPTMRRVRNNSLTSSEQGDAMAGINQVTFEDKRKENFEKGQAELDRRRKALLEIQRKEQEERQRKEREELEKQERIRLEQEKKRQEEFERQLERQREIERAREEERRRAQEQREAARKEMERQRQLEWEKQRLQELQTQRQKQQELVLSLKAKSQALSIDLTQKEDKVKELSKQISETRCGVTSVKSVIDGMRASRDTNLAEYNRLKTLVKQRNAQTLALTQQKVKLEAAGGRVAGGGGGTEEQAREQAAFNDKTILIKNLKDKLKDLEEQVKSKETDVENNNEQLENLKKELTRLLDECEELYTNYDEKRKKIFDLKGIPQPMNASDDAWSSSAWDSAPLTSPWPEEENVATPVGYAKYRALYEFIARNSDELSFQPGDIILVPTNQTAEPGWLSGELRGASGWFPESYVEPVDSTGTGLNGPLDVIPTAAPKTPLEGIVEVAESETGSVVEDSGPPLPTGPNPILGLGRAVSAQARALYSCTPSQGSQLAFLRGDLINISEIQDEWCYGQLNLSEGWLPKSYLSIEESQPSAPVKPITPEITGGRGEYYVSLYPYTSEEGGDLTFDQGEMVLVTGKEGDWWTGQIGDRVGIFPSNYVQPHQEAAPASEPAPPHAALINNLPPHKAVEEPVPERVAPVFEEAPIEKKAVSPATADAMMAAEGRVVTPDFSSLSSQVESGSGEESETKGGKGRKPLIATVIAPYQATSKEQLNLQRGQLIMIRKKTTTGWWEGELQAKGKKRQIGWFPASYVKLLGGSGRTSQPLSRKTSETGIGDCLLERVVALYQYTAQNEDELSFDKGDLVTVLAKDEPTWWKGELNGMVGLFPSNYVAPQCENGPDLNQVNNNPTEKISREEKKRQQLIKELISTEQAYIDDMSIVHDVFEKPLTESRILTTDQVRTIFINWHEILECNYSFLRALRIRREMSKGAVIRQIGDILCENLPRMRVYVRFCGCQLRAAALLQSLSELNKDFQTLTKRCQSDPRTKGLPLSSFLIKPMQRITKYPLLISKILENTSDEHSDRQYLEEALAKAEELCSQVNEGVREKENSERLEWLQSHVIGDRLSEPLVFNSLTNAVGPRKFLHFGVLTKTKSGKELVGFLMNDFLLLAQPNRPLGGQFNFDRHQNVLFRIYKQPLLLNELNILGHSNDANSVEFKLDCNKTAFNLSAVSLNEKNLWLKKLIQAQTELREHERDKLRRQQSIRKRRPKCSLKIIILGGRLLEPSAFRGVNREVFCEVSMGSQVSQTPAVPTPNGSDSKWNTSMQFLVKDLDEDVLCLTVKDKGNFSPDEFLGRTELRISEILADLRRADHGPIVKTLQLHEVRSGQVKLKLDVRLFNDNNN